MLDLNKDRVIGCAAGPPQSKGISTLVFRIRQMSSNIAFTSNYLCDLGEKLYFFVSNFLCL